MLKVRFYATKDDGQTDELAIHFGEIRLGDLDYEAEVEIAGCGLNRSYSVVGVDPIQTLLTGTQQVTLQTMRLSNEGWRLFRSAEKGDESEISPAVWHQYFSSELKPMSEPNGSS